AGARGHRRRRRAAREDRGRDLGIPAADRERPRGVPVRGAPAPRRGRPGRRPRVRDRRPGRGGHRRAPHRGRCRPVPRGAVGPRGRGDGPRGGGQLDRPSGGYEQGAVDRSPHRPGVGGPVRGGRPQRGGDAMTVDRHALQRVLDGRWAQVRNEIRAQMDELAFNPDPDLTTEEYRALTTENLKLLASTGRPRQGFDPAYGGGGAVGGAVAAFAMLGFGDLSLLVKAGVQWGLFGGAVQVLGTKHHHDAYLRQIMDGELLGCFAMTETGHGSDVQHLRTTATYDPETREFVVHTPDPGARKDYIGNAARDGRMAVVFAQLVTQGRSHGVHALLVPIRDEDGNPMPGVTIGDCGHKAGLNGVDNGRLTFDHVRVPREALLNRFGDVSEDGTYTSSIANETRRFFTMLGTLVRGRRQRHRRARGRPRPVRGPVPPVGRRRRGRHVRPPGRLGDAALLPEGRPARRGAGERGGRGVAADGEGPRAGAALRRGPAAV